MSKIPNLSLHELPKSKKSVDIKPERLGLINKAKTVSRSFRFRVETVEALSELTAKVNKKSPVKLYTTQILEMLILDAVKNPSKLLEFFNK